VAATARLHVRMDKEVKARALATLAEIGLSPADAVRLLFHRIAADQAFPEELKVPNAATRAAMAESRAILADRAARADRLVRRGPLLVLATDGEEIASGEAERGLEAVRQRGPKR